MVDLDRANTPRAVSCPSTMCTANVARCREYKRLICHTGAVFSITAVPYIYTNCTSNGITRTPTSCRRAIVRTLGQNCGYIFVASRTRVVRHSTITFRYGTPGAGAANAPHLLHFRALPGLTAPPSQRRPHHAMNMYSSRHRGIGQSLI